MVKSTGAQYVILGHSERREYYKETPEILKEKVQLALANGLKVIFCIGESLEEREANKQNEVVKAELEGARSSLLTNQSGLSVQVRLLLLSRLKKYTHTSVLALLRSTVLRLLRTLQFFMVVLARLQMLLSFSQRQTSTVDSLAVLL